MLVPIGAWCRTAFQIRQFVQAKGLSSQAFPFDWTITPFSALNSIFAPQYDPLSALRPEAVGTSQFASAQDQLSGLVFHHDLPRWTPNVGGDYRADDLARARSRFIHTFSNLLALRESPGRLGFVRWQRAGHPDPQFPEAFDGESVGELHALIGRFLGNNDFSVLVVRTRSLEPGTQAPDDPVAAFKTIGPDCEAIILERSGYDGEGDRNDFRGDHRSWEALLEKFVATQEIPL